MLPPSLGMKCMGLKISSVIEADLKQSGHSQSDP
jgi:hypothetical protein